MEPQTNQPFSFGFLLFLPEGNPIRNDGSRLVHACVYSNKFAFVYVVLVFLLGALAGSRQSLSPLGACSLPKGGGLGARKISFAVSDFFSVKSEFVVCAIAKPVVEHIADGKLMTG